MQQAVITVNTRNWDVQVPTTIAEMQQGLGGLESLAVNTGMFFDLGYDCTIGVNTLEVLFNLDIAFISNDLIVTEVLRDVVPGLTFTSSYPSRYFLELNSGELEGVEVGDTVVVTGLALPAPSVIGQLLPNIMTIVVLGVFMYMTKGMWSPKPSAIRYCPICGTKIESWAGHPLRAAAREHFAIVHSGEATDEQTKRWLQFYSRLPAEGGIRKYFTDTEDDIHRGGYMFQTQLDSAFIAAIRRVAEAARTGTAIKEFWEE